jgi:hypothetical protein
MQKKVAGKSAAKKAAPKKTLVARKNIGAGKSKAAAGRGGSVNDPVGPGGSVNDPVGPGV